MQNIANNENTQDLKAIIQIPIIYTYTYSIQLNICIANNTNTQDLKVVI